MTYRNAQRIKSFTAGQDVLNIIKQQTEASGKSSESQWLRDIIRRQTTNNTEDLKQISEHFGISEEDALVKVLAMMKFFIKNESPITLDGKDIQAWFAPGAKSEAQ